MIDEFKYGQTWKIWPSPISSSLYSTFNEKVSILTNTITNIMSNYVPNKVVTMDERNPHLINDKIKYLIQTEKKIIQELSLKIIIMMNSKN